MTNCGICSKEFWCPRWRQKKAYPHRAPGISHHMPYAPCQHGMTCTCWYAGSHGVTSQRELTTQKNQNHFAGFICGFWATHLRCADGETLRTFQSSVWSQHFDQIPENHTQAWQGETRRTSSIVLACLYYGRLSGYR